MIDFLYAFFLIESQELEESEESTESEESEESEEDIPFMDKVDSYQRKTG